MKNAKVQLNSVAARDKLPASQSVYYQALGRGRFLGLRKASAGSPGTWRARYRASGASGYQHAALGDFCHLPAAARFDAARRAAEQWFNHVTGGGTAEKFSVAQVCQRYIAALAAQGKLTSSEHARQFFDLFVHSDKAFAQTMLTDLTAPMVAKWRDRLQGTPLKSGRNKGAPRSTITFNRNISALRAALNQAFAQQLCASDAAWSRELVDKPELKNPRREYLTPAQRQALIEAAPPDLGLFLTAMARLPMRPGALAALTVRNFDERTGTLIIGVDKGHAPRSIGLPVSTREFFAGLCRGRAPDAPLLARADGSHWNKDGWKAPFRAICRTLGLPDSVVMYVLRHSTISDLCAVAPAVEVAKLSGTSIAQIDAVYFQSQPGRQAEFLTVLEPPRVVAPAPFNEIAALRAEIEALRTRLETLV